MPYSRLLKLGSTTFPLGTSVASIERGRTIGHQKVARRHGAQQTAGYRNGIRITLRIPLARGPLDQSVLRDREDDARAMLAIGPADLYLYDDRYYRCMESEREPEVIGPTGFDRVHEMEAYLLGPDPLMFDTVENTDTWTPSGTGDTNTFTAGGNAQAAPSISLTVGGSGAETIAFAVTNNTTGEAFTLDGDVTAGDIIVIDTIRLSTKISGTNRMDLFDGIFPHFDVGANELQVDWTSSSITGVSVTWRDRWE